MTEPAPFRTDLAYDVQGGRVEWRHAPDGRLLRSGVWDGQMGGTVLLFTGRTEYLEKYGRAIAELRDRGLNVVSCDWRGQGLSSRAAGRLVGHVDDYAEFQSDVAVLRALAADLPRPHYLLAHSMGGCIGLRALLEGLDVEKAVFSAPMWAINFPPSLALLAKALSGTAVNFGFGTAQAPGGGREAYTLSVRFEDNVLTGDRPTFEHMQKTLREVPLMQLAGPSFGWISASMRETAELSWASMPETECLVFLGTEEAVVQPDAIRRGVERLPNAELVEVEGSHHEILMETPELRGVFWKEFDRFIGV